MISKSLSRSQHQRTGDKYKRILYKNYFWPSLVLPFFSVAYPTTAFIRIQPTFWVVPLTPTEIRSWAQPREYWTKSPTIALTIQIQHQLHSRQATTLFEECFCCLALPHHPFSQNCCDDRNYAFIPSLNRYRKFLLVLIAWTRQRQDNLDLKKLSGFPLLSSASERISKCFRQWAMQCESLVF